MAFFHQPLDTSWLGTLNDPGLPDCTLRAGGTTSRVRDLMSPGVNDRDNRNNNRGAADGTNDNADKDDSTSAGPSNSAIIAHNGKKFPVALAKTLSKVLSKATKHKGPVAKEDNKFLNLPMDVMVKVLEHLDPIDRVMMKYSCKSLNTTVPSIGTYPLLSRTCGKTRMMVRLIDSNLLPTFRRGRELLTKPEIKAVLRNESQCEMCDNYWHTVSPIQCPFHYQLNAIPKTPLLENIRASLIKARPDSVVRHVFRRISVGRLVSQKGYHDFVERAVSKAPMSEFQTFDYYFVVTWAHQIAEWEDSGLYETIHGKRQIWTLHCCNHCMNVLPNNSYLLQCQYCDCAMCGWTPVEVLRVEGKNDGVPRFIPLGHLEKGADRKSLKGLTKTYGKRYFD